MSGELSEVGVQRFKGVGDSQRLYGVRRDAITPRKRTEAPGCALGRYRALQTRARFVSRA